MTTTTTTNKNLYKYIKVDESDKRPNSTISWSGYKARNCKMCDNPTLMCHVLASPKHSMIGEYCRSCAATLTGMSETYLAELEQDWENRRYIWKTLQNGDIVCVPIDFIPNATDLVKLFRDNTKQFVSSMHNKTDAEKMFFTMSLQDDNPSNDDIRTLKGAFIDAYSSGKNIKFRTKTQPAPKTTPTVNTHRITDPHLSKICKKLLGMELSNFERRIVEDVFCGEKRTQYDKFFKQIIDFRLGDSGETFKPVNGAK